MRFWTALIGLTVLVVVLSACGGGGGGSRSLIIPPAGTDQNSGGNDRLPPAFESVEVEVPLAAEEAGEVGGIVADYLGNTVPDLDVYLNSTDNLVSSTDEGGKFVMAGVATGEHELMIGVEGTVVASYTLTYDDTTPMNLALSPSGLRTVSEFESFGALAGRVTNEEENPIPGVRVLIFNDDGFFLVKHTNENGVYEFPRVPVGEYRLLGFKRGYRTHVGQVAIHADELTAYDFVMHGFPVGRVIGVVGDEEGRALPRVHVFLLYREGEGDRPPLSFHTMTNEHGEYAFYEVPAGVADMLAFKAGYEPEDAEVTVPPQGQVVQNFVLHQIGPPPPPPPDYAFLTGYVFGGPDEPLVGALVELIRPEGIYFSATTDERGFYRIAEIPVGPYVYEVSAEGYTPIRGELLLLPGQNHKNFYLPPVPPAGGSIEGTVFWGETEERVVGAHVELWIPGDDGQLHKIRETQTNENGRFGFGEVPPGPGVVKAFKEECSGATEYTLEPGGHIELAVRIFPHEEWGGKIIGRTRIVDPEHPDQFINIPGVEVKLFYGPPGEDTPPLAVTTSGEGGLYQFLNLPPTEPDRQYVLVAHKLMEGQMWAGVEDTPLGENQVVELHITLHPENPPPPGAIYGFIFRGETDNKVPGAHILLFHGVPGEDNPPIRETWSADGGAYHLWELPPSGDLPYVIVAEKEMEGQLWRGAVDTHLEQGQEKQVDIRIFPVPPPQNGVLFGQVLRPNPENPDQFLPVPCASVKLWHGEPEGPPLRTATTGPEGWFEFGELAPSGEIPYVLFAEKWIEEVHFAGWADGIWIPPGGEVRVDVVIHADEEPPPSDGAIYGYIIRQDPENPDGEMVVPGAVVKLFHGDPEGQEPLRVAESNGEGYYCFGELEPSGEMPYVVVAHKWIEEVFFWGMDDTYLEQGDHVQLNVWIWPGD